MHVIIWAGMNMYANTHVADYIHVYANTRKHTHMQKYAYWT